jgi:predicted nucleic acid-binding Zn finger protein
MFVDSDFSVKKKKNEINSKLNYKTLDIFFYIIRQKYLKYENLICFSQSFLLQLCLNFSFYFLLPFHVIKLDKNTSTNFYQRIISYYKTVIDLILINDLII